MTIGELRERIGEGELTVREVFSASLLLMLSRFGKYMLLSVLVFFPANLITELFVANLPEELELAQYSKVYLLFIAVNLFGMIASCVSAVMAQRQMQNDDNLPFGECFAKGFAAWPRFLITAFLFFSMLIAVLFLALAAGAVMPLLFIPVMAVIVLLVLFGSMFLYLIAITAALRKMMLFQNLRYCISLLRDHLGKSVGLFLLLSIVSILIPLPVISMVDMLLGYMVPKLVYVLVSAAVSAVMSVVNTYVAIAFSVYYINLELLRWGIPLKRLPE